MKAIVLAGGFGTRLRERVPDLPKPMAPVAGRPFLEYVLDRLIAGGVSEIILSVGYRADAVIGHFGNVYRNATVSYAVESEPLGTGGAIVHALKDQNDDPVLVLNGDTFLSIDYAEFVHWYAQSPAQVAMVLREVSDVTRYGSVLVDDERVFSFVEKGKVGCGLINAGVYVVNPEVFKALVLPGKFEFETDILQNYCDVLKPRAFITNEYFVDIGIPDDYERAQNELAAML